jgi:hypothetical protein
MAATSVTDAEISTATGEGALDLLAASDLELARLLVGKGTGQEHQALDSIAGQMLEGAQNLRRWLWTMLLVALALVVVGFVAPSP